MNKTKQQLANAVRKLLLSNSLEKIAIANICEQAQLTRQTFYNNFKDKYDLVNWMFDQLFDSTFLMIENKHDWRKSIELFLGDIAANGNFYTPCYQYMGQNCLEAHHYERVFDCYYRVWKMNKGAELTPEEHFSLEVYCRGAVFIVGQWARSKMQQSSEQMTFLFKHAMTEEIRKGLGV